MTIDTLARLLDDREVSVEATPRPLRNSAILEEIMQTARDLTPEDLKIVLSIVKRMAGKGETI
jgi:hypothetical protein